MTKKKIISAVIAGLISLFFLYLAFSRIDLKALVESFKSIAWWWSIPFLIITWISFWWRTLRWQNLLEPTRRIKSWSLFGPMMIGFGFNSIFPARAGEFARPLALTKTEKIPFTTGLSTVFLERVLDSMTLLGLFMLAPFFFDFDNGVSLSYDTTRVVPGETLRMYLKCGMIALGVLAALVMGGWYLFERKRIEKDRYLTLAQSRKLTVLGAVVIVLTTIAGFILIHGQLELKDEYTFGASGVITPDGLREIVSGTSKLIAILFLGSVAMMFEQFRNLTLKIILAIPLIPHGIKEKVSELFQTFAKGFDAMKKPWLATQIIFHSLMVWFLTGASFWLMSYAVPGIDMTLTTGMAFLIITCIAILIPAAPGYWGLYEVGGVLSLIITGVVENTAEGRALALGYTIVVHFMQWGLVTVIGLFYAGKIHVSAGEAQAVHEEQETQTVTTSS
ncbi:flippase-like domain-containing protein [bacterium]|nr:flippase-like domain-containing protein [bacterium]